MSGERKKSNGNETTVTTAARHQLCGRCKMRFARAFVFILLTGMQKLRGRPQEITVKESITTDASVNFTNSTLVPYSSYQMTWMKTQMECGKRGESPLTLNKIVGGTKAGKHEFPWQARQETNWNIHVCGSIVIDFSWMMTAAHCLYYYEPSQLLIVAGDYDRLEDEGSEQKREVESITVHPDYNTTTNENDIGLVKLVEPLKFGVSVSPICLPTHEFDILEGRECVVTGWGYTSQGGKLSNVLMKVNVPIISDGECQDNYSKKNKKISNHMICAGYSAGGKDSCQADSGGPLACLGPNNQYFLAGVVSWGWGCANPSFPGVYTEVSHYLTWIESVMRDHHTKDKHFLRTRLGD